MPDRGVSTNGAVRKNRIKELEAEVADLRARLNLQQETTIETWATHLPQAMRDRIAARALIAEWGDEPRALRRLGFTVEVKANNQLHKETKELAKQIFGAPGVQAILAEQMADIESQKGAILARMAEVATSGSDGDAVRAAAQISKVAGWQKQGDNPAQPVTTNLLLQIVNSHGTMTATTNATPAITESGMTTIDAADFLTHIPGEATLLDADETPKALTRVGVTDENA